MVPPFDEIGVADDVDDQAHVRVLPAAKFGALAAVDARLLGNDRDVAVAPGDPRALAKAFRTMADASDDERRAMGLRGRALYLAELGSVSGATALEALLQDAIQGRRR